MKVARSFVAAVATAGHLYAMGKNLLPNAKYKVVLNLFFIT